MNENWVIIQEFPRYAVSETGLVQNLDSGRLMKQSLNSHGIPIVGLVRNRIQYKRSVAVLVAERFLEEPDPNYENPTPINMNGNRFDNHACNLTWRPRWFAYNYACQFKRERIGYNLPIQEMDTYEIFPNSWTAAQTYGLLDIDVLNAVMKCDEVWPTRQLFRIVPKF